MGEGALFFIILLTERAPPLSNPLHTIFPFPCFVFAYCIDFSLLCFRSLVVSL